MFNLLKLYIDFLCRDSCYFQNVPCGQLIGSLWATRRSQTLCRLPLVYTNVSTDASTLWDKSFTCPDSSSTQTTKEKQWKYFQKCWIVSFHLDVTWRCCCWLLQYLSFPHPTGCEVCVCVCVCVCPLWRKVKNVSKGDLLSQTYKPQIWYS